MAYNPRNLVFAEKKAPAAAGKTSPSLIHFIKSKERHFCLPECACGSREDFTKPDTCHKISGTSFLPKKCLRQPRRPQQDINKSQKHIFGQKKAPAAAGNTSPCLIHVTKSRERHFCRKKRLRQPGRFHQATIHKWLWLFL